MKKYIDKPFEKAFIKLSLLVAVAPVLLIRKPGGGLRFCVDYKVEKKSKWKIDIQYH